VKTLLEKSGAAGSEIACVGISNQRETIAAWERGTGRPVCNAIVWQCARGAAIAERVGTAGWGELIRRRTGLRLSPYFSAAKMAWILENVPAAKKLAATGELCLGTMDSWLIRSLSRERYFRTDCSNASRTQLFDIAGNRWDEELCGAFGVPADCLPEVCDTNALFGTTDFLGVLKTPVPIFSAVGDSSGALYAQGCVCPGMIKATYGTGSSVMMNIGAEPRFAGDGAVTSEAWRLNGAPSYVFEGNVNYTGGVVTWLKDQAGLIGSPAETEALARAADPDDLTCFVPAFTGLGAPHWNNRARGVLCGMTRTTGRAEIVRAALDSIAFQIQDVLSAMASAGAPVTELRADGGATKNGYLMQMQSDISGIPILVSSENELSGIGAALLAGKACGALEPDTNFGKREYRRYVPKMAERERARRYGAWKDAVALALASGK